MRVVRKAEQQHFDAAAEQHQEVLAAHEEHADEIKQVNVETKKKVEHHRRELTAQYEKLVEAREQGPDRRRIPATLKAAAEKVLGREIGALPPPPEVPEPELPVFEAIPVPDPPVLPVAEPEVFEAEQHLLDEELDRAQPEVEDHKMIGPVRVQHGDWVLVSRDTGATHVVTHEDFEHRYLQQ